MAFVRSENPKWFFNDHIGQPLNDEYYAFFLTNTLPYIPQLVYRDPQGLTVWTGGVVEFEPSGGLPDNLYFDDTLVYRIEIRHGNTQDDELIWEINNYVPQGSGSAPALFNATSDNQITNPEFVIVNFAGSTTSTSNEFSVAPGWDIITTGTGTITVMQIPVSGTDDILTNPAYVLNIALSGSFSTAILRQRIYNNGALFRANSNTLSAILRQRIYNNGALFRANSNTLSAIAGNFVAKSNSGDYLATMSYQDSAGNIFNIISGVTVTGAYKEFANAIDLPNMPENPDNSNIGYVDIYITLPATGNVNISSVQLVKQITPVTVPYLQETPARQIDHTFHYYKNPLVNKPVPSYAIGWDFSINPSQNGEAYTVTSTPDYTWDMTIMQSINSVAVARNTVTRGMQFTTSSANEAVMMMQYIENGSDLNIGKVCSNISAWKAIGGSDVTVRVYVLWGNNSSVYPTLPTTLGVLNADATFTITPANNWNIMPRDTLPVAMGTLSVVNTADYSTLTDVTDLKFTDWELTATADIAAARRYAIIVTFFCPTTSTVVNIDSISLQTGILPTIPPAQPFSEVWAQCMAYYEKSYDRLIAPGTVTATGERYTLVELATSNSTFKLQSFQIQFQVNKILTPMVTIYAPTSVTPNQGLAQILRNGMPTDPVSVGPNPLIVPIVTAVGSPNYSLTGEGLANVFMRCLDTTTSYITTTTPAVGDEGMLLYHYVLDGRPGKL